MIPAADPQLAILAAAVALRDAGCTVVPTRKDGGKAPAGKWKDYQSTPPTGQQIADWFSTQAHTGIGIITGKASGNIEMIELEGRAVEAGMLQSIEQLATNSGLADLYDRITQGWCERSPSGGIHWFLRITDGIVFGNTKLANDPDGLCLAETRGEGGFVVVAPSHGNVHPTGNPWEIITGGPTTIANITYEERNAFIALFQAQGSSKPSPTNETAQETAQNPSDTSRPGDDYNQRAHWEDILEPHGWTKAYTDRDGITYWVRPGKNVRDGISATTGRNDGDNLYVFSSSTTFDTEKAYSKFAAYTQLNHNGDYTTAARALALEGYGDQTPPPTNELKPLNTLQPAPTPTPTNNTDTTDDDESTWKPVNLQPHWDGTHTRPTTTQLWREDGIALLYPGRVHSFYGESESGKSWLAQIATAETLKAQGTVAYIDFEADATDIVDRLQLLGITPHHNHNFRYLRPETPRKLDDPHWLELLQTPTDLIIIDGVTEALTMWGGETKDNDTITRWTRTFPRQLARTTGAAVITIDHVAKNADNRGRFAIGGQAKLAAIDGAAYLIEPLEPLAPGVTGRLTIRVTKDRPGTVRAAAGAWRKTDRTQEAALAIIDATHTPITYRLEQPKTELEIAELQRDNLDRAIIEHVIAHPGCGFNKLTDAVHKDEKTIRARLMELIDDGYIKDLGERRHGKPMILIPTDRAQQEYHGQLRALNDAI